MFISRSYNTSHDFNANCPNFMTNQQPGSVTIDGALSNFSFALIFKNLIEFQVNARKLPAVKAFKPDLARNCSNKTNPLNVTGCYNIYRLNNSNLNWSSYEPSEGGIMRGYDTNSSFFMNLKVSFL